MLKILGSVLILTASVGGCLTFLERFREEERQLLAMKEMLIIFEKQLEYVRLPIAEAVTDMAKKAGAPFEAPLMEFTEKILTKPMPPAKALYTSLTGFSPVMANELLYRASLQDAFF